MRNLLKILYRWFPALLLMLAIFRFSARASYELPNFDWADRIVKKGGHMVGYGLLALCYWRALQFRREERLLAWLLTFAYALTDEFHQSFVPGRGSSIWDVIIFDNVGALISLWLASWYRKEKRPDVHPIVERARANRS
jgi:VanZ family protein